MVWLKGCALQPLSLSMQARLQHHFDASVFLEAEKAVSARRISQPHPGASSRTGFSLPVCLCPATQVRDPCQTQINLRPVYPDRDKAWNPGKT